MLENEEEDCIKKVKGQSTLDRAEMQIERNRLLDFNTGDLFVRGISLCSEDAN